MTIDEFRKVDLRVGKIISAERVDGSDKLLKLQVNIGPSAPNGSDEASTPRQILTGIAKTHAPEELVGKEVVVIANLEPRMMMGMESQGMILATASENGDTVLLAPEREVPPGSKIT